MKTKILNLLKSPNIDDQKLGFQLAKTHMPEILEKIEMLKELSGYMYKKPRLVDGYGCLYSCIRRIGVYHIISEINKLIEVANIIKYLKIDTPIVCHNSDITLINLPYVCIILRQCTVLDGAKITCRNLILDYCEFIGSPTIKVLNTQV